MITIAALLFVTAPTDAALIAALRERGQAGLNDAMGDPRAARLVDAIAAQKDARFTGAFWYTSLDDALREAKRTHKPVLSLRLLGRLDEELSCANSRYFRSLVYPDPQVSALLREKFVLHWQSVRPAPKVTIDMGDGRTLVTTVTGNSAHIVLDENGAVIDAIPGLYDAPAFADALNDALAIAHESPSAQDRQRAHRERVARIDARWPVLARAAGFEGAALPVLDEASNDALDISSRAIAKAIPERALLQRIDERKTAPDLNPVFQNIGRIQGALLRLSPNALAIFRSQLADEVNERAALAKTLSAMAADSAQNENLFHRQIHQWLAGAGGALLDADTLQHRMYDEMFKTPDADPWLGLIGRDYYTGVGGGGVR